MPSRSDSAAVRLHDAGVFVLAVMPLAMALATKSSPAIVGLAALLCLAGAAFGNRVAWDADLVAPLRTPLGLAALAFLAWCVVSLAWSPFPGLSLRTLSEFVPTLVAAYLVTRLVPGRLPPATLPLATACLALAGLYVLANLFFDLAPLRALGQRGIAAFVLNRPVMTILLVAGPLAALLLRRGRRIGALVVLVLGTAAVMRSISGAAMLGLIAGGATAALAVLPPKRIGLGLVGGALGLGLVLAPVEGDLLQRFMPEAVHARLVQSSSRARVAIAQSFGAATAADPWRGAGFGTSARFAQMPAAAALEPEMRHMLAVGHPHNSFLQVWAELGIVGATLAAATLFLALRAVAGLPKPLFATALGLFAAAAAIAFVEHGAWQAWWTAALGTAITWLRAAAMEPPRRTIGQTEPTGAA